MKKNATYRNNILSLNKMLLIYSTNDTIIIPNTAPWFQHYKEGQDVEVVEFRDTEQYLGDWLGLQTMDIQGRLLMHSVPCGHTQIPRGCGKIWYDKYTKPLLNNKL